MSDRSSTQLIRCAVVDDNPSALKLIALWCHQDDRVDLVYSSLSSTETLVYVTQNPTSIDILFSDVHMPELDGIELIRRINESLEHSPLFVLNTGQSQYGPQDVGFPIHGFMDKPITYTEFRKIITKALDINLLGHES